MPGASDLLDQAVSGAWVYNKNSYENIDGSGEIFDEEKVYKIKSEKHIEEIVWMCSGMEAVT